jgi:hypothetical protein
LSRPSRRNCRSARYHDTFVVARYFDKVSMSWAFSSGHHFRQVMLEGAPQKRCWQPRVDVGGLP